MQPYLSANNLSVAPPKTLKSGPNGSQQFMNNKKGGENLTASGVGDVEVLNKILNNINVQTKKGE